MDYLRVLDSEVSNEKGSVVKKIARPLLKYVIQCGCVVQNVLY